MFSGYSDSSSMGLLEKLRISEVIRFSKIAGVL
jgi:hypothetical protein